MSTEAQGLGERLVRWMAAHRDALDAMMVEEGSRAIHEEFLMAEGGSLPDRGGRMERARGASARAWMRHLGRGLAATWEGADPGLSGRLERWTAAHGERLEALALEEAAAAERRGASGDPTADRRDVALVAHCRLFAESLGHEAAPLQGTAPPELGRRVAAWVRAHENDRRRVQAEAVAAWSAGPEEGGQPSTAVSERVPDTLRVEEAAAVWAHVRVLADALEHVLAGPAGGAPG